MELSKQVGIFYLEEEMKSLFVIFAVSYLSASISYGAEYWAKKYWVNDYYAAALSFKQVTDGGYILAGKSEGTSEDMLVMKLDFNGSVLWQKSYGWLYARDYAVSIKQTSDGGYIVAGNSQSDILILKLYGNGEIAWQKRIWDVGIPDYIQQTTDSGYILLTGAGIVKLNSTGDITWQKAYIDVIPGLFESMQQTEDGGYVLSGYRELYDDGHIWIQSMWVMKLDGSGNIVWQKQYGECYYRNIAHSIKQTEDGGYIVAGGSRCNSTYIDFHVMKLDSSGNILWQKAYGTYYDDVANSIQQTSDGGYVVAGYTDTDWNYTDCMVLKLDGNGNISWQRTYGEADKSEKAYSIEQTADGGYIVVGSASGNLFILKLNSNGDIPNCNIVDNSDVSIYSWSDSPQDTTVNYQPTSFNIDNTQFIPRVDSHSIHTICSWIDTDADGIPDQEDNCPLHPNSPDLGICLWSYTGTTCLSDEECGYNGFCSMDQADDINCDCPSNFDCDYDVDGSDAAKFKADFGIVLFDIPCTNEDPCNGDFECDGDVDGTNAAKFKERYGTVPLPPYGYCLSCVDGVYQYECSY